MVAFIKTKVYLHGINAAEQKGKGTDFWGAPLKMQAKTRSQLHK